MPACSDSTTASRSASHCLRLSCVGAPQRVDAGAEQRLVGVDVADARDPLLVEQQRLDRRAAALGERVQVRAGELRRRTARRPRRAAKNASSASAPSASSPVPKRRGSTNSSSRVAEVEGHARVRRALGRAAAAACRSSAGAASGRPRPRAPTRGTCRGGRAARRARPSTAAASSAGASGSDQRASWISSALERAALDVRRQVAADRLDLGQLGHGGSEARRTEVRIQRAGRGRGAPSESPSVRRDGAVGQPRRPPRPGSVLVVEGVVELEEALAAEALDDVERRRRRVGVGGRLAVAAEARDRVGLARAPGRLSARRARRGLARDAARRRRRPGGPRRRRARCPRSATRACGPR